MIRYYFSTAKTEKFTRIKVYFLQEDISSTIVIEISRFAINIQIVDNYN